MGYLFPLPAQLKLLAKSLARMCLINLPVMSFGVVPPIVERCIVYNIDTREATSKKVLS